MKFVQDLAYADGLFKIVAVAVVEHQRKGITDGLANGLGNLDVLLDPLGGPFLVCRIALGASVGQIGVDFESVGACAVLLLRPDRYSAVSVRSGIPASRQRRFIRFREPRSSATGLAWLRP